MLSRSAQNTLLYAVPLLLAAAGCSPDAMDGTAAAPQGWVSADGRAAGQVQIVGGDIVLLPRRDVPPPGMGLGPNGRHVLFLNMEGADLRPGGSNALENVGIRDRSKENQGVIELEPYAPMAPDRYQKMLEIQKLVAGWYADFNVDVVISRPLSGDYMMTVVGGSRSDLGYGGGIVGISPGDCRNQNEVDLNYAFSASLGHAVYQTALTAAHEAGHAYGLGHTRNNRDIMFPTVVPQVDGFASGEVADPGPCGARPGDIQDGPEVLRRNLGARDPVSPRPGDSVPSVSFLSPPGLGEGTGVVDVGREVTVAVRTESRLGIDHVTISASLIEGGRARGGHPVAELRPPGAAATVRFSVAGEYLLVATAYDRAGNVALAQGRIRVASPTCTVPNDCAPGQRCINNVCTTPPLPDNQPEVLRPWGMACTRSAECVGGICAITQVGQICTHYCNPDRFCAVGDLECVDGVCLPPMVQRTEPKIGQLGGRCTRNQDCYSGECSPSSPEDPMAPRYCTKVCDPHLAWSCPAHMVCVETEGATGTKHRCMLAPVRPPTAAGCSSVPGRQESWAAFFLILLLLAQMGRRRYGKLAAVPARPR
ncbi:MAG: matrixin family metalloprotease [Myxococcales bacterium]|nr:matrixin family metalloprotease [Myxococcota bacterium]MDW8283673.1 matrixin family metalloprotease [Myxococcales bacterium]